MVWVCAKYVFGSTFSYRIPGFSSSYAAAAPVPSPSTVKLALVATAIEENGNVGIGRELFEKIKTAQVVIEVPEKITIFKSFIKRLKKKRSGKGFDRTFGIREYVLYSEPLAVFIYVSNNSVKDLVVKSLKRVRYFGTSDSICTNIECDFREPSWEKVPRPYSPKETEGIIFLLTDFTENTTFDAVSPYSKTSLNGGKHIVKQPYIFPLKVVEKGKTYTIYELNPFSSFEPFLVY